MTEHENRNPPEQRTVDVDVGELSTEGNTLHGHAAVFNVLSEDLGGFRERIAPGAFTGVLSDDVRLLVDHKPPPLARTKAGTLRLSEDEQGLVFEADLPSTTAARDLRESVSRGDLDGASFRFQVGDEQWDGDVRTVTKVARLHDVTVATYPAYPEASIELRSRQHTTAAPERQEETKVEQETTEAPAEERAANENDGEERAEDRSEQTEERTTSTGSLRVEERTSAPRRGLADEFRARGWPGETATLEWPEYRTAIEFRTLTVSGSVDDINQAERESVPLGYDVRYLWPVVPQVPVGRDVTSVHVLQQTARSLASASNVIRDITATSTKPETGSTVDDVVVPLKQVASVQSGVPNIHLEQPAFRSVIEQDLRHSLDGGLDKLVLDAIAASGFQAPGSDPLLVSIRKAMTTIQGNGYNADTVILRPQDAEALDTLVSGITGGTNDFVFAPAQLAPRTIYGLQVRISKSIPAAAVADVQALGKLYVSPITLARFEEDAGATNKSTVRLEGHAAFGTERQAAAVRIAAS